MSKRSIFYPTPLVRIENSRSSVGVEKKTGWIRSMVWKDKQIDLFKQLQQEIRGYIGGLRIYDEVDKKWFSDFDQKFTVKDFQCEGNTITYLKQFAGAKFSVKVTLSMDEDCFTWHVDMEKRGKKVADRSIRVHFMIPMIAGWMVWAPAYKSDLLFDGMTTFDYSYSQIPFSGTSHEVVVPIISHYERTKDVGYSVIVPYDKKVPAAKFEFQNGDRDFNWGGHEVDPANYPVLEVVNYYIGLIKDRQLQTEVKVFFHEGDWRPGLGQTVEKYREYFYPANDCIHDKAGLYHCGTLSTSFNAKQQRALGMTFFEYHGHFPWYGYYMPKEKTWRMCAIVEEVARRGRGKITYKQAMQLSVKCSQKELAKRGLLPKNYVIPELYDLSRESIRKSIDRFLEYGINPMFYINFSDGFEPWVEEHFSSSICTLENGKKQNTGWPLQRLMNPDLSVPFGKHILETAREMMGVYPRLGGFFYDCFRHVGIDFAHDDGVTVANNKPVYSVNFGFDGITERIHKELLEGRNRCCFANKSQNIRCQKYVDGILLEGDGDVIEEKFFYSALAMPLFTLWGSDARTVEENLKRCLMYGSFPTTPALSDMSPKLRDKQFKEAMKTYGKYIPLYEHFKRRVFCFEQDPIRMSNGLIGKLFTVPDGYVAGIMTDELSVNDKISFAKDKYVYFQVKRGHDIGQVLVQYPGDKKPRPVKFQFNGSIIMVPLKGYKNCCVVKLVVTRNTGKPFKRMPFQEVVDNCGDPKAAFLVIHD